MKIRNRWICALLMLLLLVCAVPLAASAEEFTIVDTYSHYGTYAVQVGEEITFSMEPAEPELNDGTTHVTKYWIEAVDWKGYKDGYLKTVTDKDTYYRTFLGAPVFTMKFDKPGIYNVCLDNQTFDDTVGYQIWKWTYLHIIVWDYDETTYVENGHDLKVLIDDIPADKDKDGAKRIYAHHFMQSRPIPGKNPFIFEESVKFPDYFDFYTIADAVIPEDVTVIAKASNNITCQLNMTVDGALACSQVGCANLTVNGTLNLYEKLTWQTLSIDYGSLTVDGILNNYGSIYAYALTVNGQLNMYEDSAIELYGWSLKEGNSHGIQNVIFKSPSAKGTYYYDGTNSDSFDSLAFVANAAASNPCWKYYYEVSDYYFGQFTMSSDLTIPANMEAVVGLEIPKGCTLTNNGILSLSGYPEGLMNRGKIVNNGDLSGERLAGGVVENSGTIHDSDIGFSGTSVNTGTINNCRINGSFVNNGTVNNSDIELSSSTLTNNGSINLSGDNCIEIRSGRGYLANAGTINLTENSTVYLNDDGLYSGNGVFYTSDSALPAWTDIVTANQEKYNVTVSEDGNSMYIDIKEIRTGTWGENVTWDLTDNGTLVISGEGRVCAYYDASPAWYLHLSSFDSVAVEEGITIIGDNAFGGYNNGFDNIEKISLPDSLTTIENYAFMNCYNLKEITIPKGVTSISRSAFDGCTSLPGFTVDPDSPYLSNDAYGVLFNKDKTQLLMVLEHLAGEYTIPSTVTSIGEDAFLGCDLTKVVIPGNVVSIGKQAFMNSVFLTDVIMEDGVTDIGPCAFWFCFSLKNVTIPESVTSIGHTAFASCEKLNDVVVPGSVSAIGGSAFSHCDALTNITIQEGVKEIQSGAFWDCPALATITIPSSVTKIGSTAFEDCIALKSVYFKGDAPAFGGDNIFDCILSDTTIEAECIYLGGTQGWYDSVLQNYGGNLTWYILCPACESQNSYTSTTVEPTCTEQGYRNNVCSECGHTFADWYSDVLPHNYASVVTGSTCTTQGYTTYTCKDCGDSYKGAYTEVSDHNFEHGVCTGCGEINYVASGSCGENVSWTLMETGVLTISGEGPMADCTETYPSWYAYRKSITSVVIEDGVTTVGTYAFYATDFYAIEEIHLPSSITEIKAGAFAYCHGLTEVTLPDNLTEIGVSAFYYCSKLKSVTMPDTVTTIGTQAFIYCYSLAEVDFSNNLTEIGNHAFYECRAMQSISLPNKVKTIGNWAFYNCDGVTEVTIPASVTTIGECAFLECDNLTAFAVKAKNTAFCNDSKGVLYSKDMTRLFQAPCAIAGSYAIPAGVVTIDTNAFWNCDALTNVSIPASVTNIGMAAFGSGDVLNGITVDSANPNFCSDAGFLFDKNKTVLLQAPTTYQGSYTVPASVTTIGSSSFEVCAGLTEIVFPANLKAIQDYAFWRCTSLKKITFQGDAPVIGTDVFEEVTATCYYPEGNQTWTDEVMQNYADTLTWEASTSKIDCESAGHNWKAATCTDAKTCKVCGKTSGKALGHDLGAWKTTVKPTTSQSGRETRECERNGCDFSEHRSLGKKPAKPVVKAANVDSSGKIKISWGKVGGAEEYVVYRATSQNGSYKKLTVTSGISYTDKSAAAGKTYFYKVCAVSKTGVVSSYSSVVSKTCKLATPTLTVTHKQAVSQNVIKWTKITGAAKYEVQVSVNGGAYKTLTTTSKLTYTHRNVVGGNVYRYRVIAKSATAQSAYSAVKTVTAMCPAPGGVKIALVAKKPVISWNTVSGAKKYQVYVSTSKTGKYTLLKTVTTKKLSHKAAAKGKTYFYKVRAVDAKGNLGAFSVVKSIRIK